MRFPSHLKNSRLRTPSFSGLQDLFALNCCKGLGSGSNSLPWLWLAITSFHRTNIESLEVMILISLWMSSASSGVFSFFSRLWVFLTLIAVKWCFIASRNSCYITIFFELGEFYYTCVCFERNFSRVGPRIQLELT